MLVIDDALTAEDFHALIAAYLPLSPDGRVALAVSGGPDSMALAFLMKRWCEQNKFPPPHCFIVDHKLRAESADEALLVKQRLESLGLVADILSWTHDPVTSKLHALARKARYHLLVEACQKNHVKTLLFAHQREDQAETILMRFAKGTGLDGLAGIPKESRMGDLCILRPLLDVSKQRLIATCQTENISFVTDPSNNLEKFARGRLRRVMPLLAEEGLTIERLVDFGVRAAEARDALEHFSHEFLREAGRQDEFGTVFLNKEKLRHAPRAIALRAISHALQTVHADAYTPPHTSLSLLLDALADDAMPAKTLNGCLVSERQGEVSIAREYNAITEVVALHAGSTTPWDGRWRVSLASEAGAGNYLVKALGSPGHELLDRLSPGLRHKLPQGRVRSSLPALWLGDEISVIPFFSQNSWVKAEILLPWQP
jgi:tRNA(Ile)-lysidine synthase